MMKDVKRVTFWKNRFTSFAWVGPLKSLNFPFLETLLRELKERLMLYFEEYLAKLEKVEKNLCREHVTPRSLCSGDIFLECQL